MSNNYFYMEFKCPFDPLYVVSIGENNEGVWAFLSIGEDVESGGLLFSRENMPKSAISCSVPCCSKANGTMIYGEADFYVEWQLGDTLYGGIYFKEELIAILNEQMEESFYSLLVENSHERNAALFPFTSQEDNLIVITKKPGFRIYFKRSLSVPDNTEYFITGQDLEEEIAYINSKGLRSIVLSREYCGDRIQDLGFLLDCPGVLKLQVEDDDFELGKLSQLNNLCFLKVNTCSPIDYSSLTNLRCLVTNQMPPYSFPKNLTSLYIQNVDCKGEDLDSLSLPNSLLSLCLKRVNITSLNGLPLELISLQVHECQSLISLGGIESCTYLNSLILTHCSAISDYFVLAKCSLLSKLCINDCAPFTKIEFIEDLRALSWVDLRGTDVLSNNLQPLLSLPNLDWINLYFTDREGYNLRMADLEGEY